MTPQTAIVSALLCDPAAKPTRPLALTAPDPDFTASIRDGHTESLDDWTRRVLGQEAGQ
ncbi:hypothetical protein [Streptomyces flavochromogenes]|uniref:hypothetical protein n=1 Tax=Streptomyces flavochromogenes TaxID=68199 RepID=UPI000AF82E58|nr:hypothetical protein [Streptomyces flavochromogenes]